VYEGYEITVKKVSGLRISSVQVRKGISPEPKQELEVAPEQAEAEDGTADEPAEIQPTEAEQTAPQLGESGEPETSMADNREAGDR